MRLIHLVSVSLCSLIIVGCSSKKDYVLFHEQTVSQNNKVINLHNIKFEYKIVPHDRISISTYKQPELTTASTQNPAQESGILVDSSGYISIPLAGEIKLSGLTQREASKRVENALKRYLKYPQVSIEVLNKRAYIIGEVKNPGEVPLVNDHLTLIEMIAKTGDLTDYADRSSILILKMDGGVARTTVVNLNDVRSISVANLIIRPNDIVYVMPNSMKAFNVGVKEVSPIAGLVQGVLGSFVNVKYLDN